MLALFTLVGYPMGNASILFGFVRRHTDLLLPIQSSGLCTSLPSVITYD